MVDELATQSFQKELVRHAERSRQLAAIGPVLFDPTMWWRHEVYHARQDFSPEQIALLKQHASRSDTPIISAQGISEQGKQELAGVASLLMKTWITALPVEKRAVVERRYDPSAGTVEVIAEGQPSNAVAAWHTDCDIGLNVAPWAETGTPPPLILTWTDCNSDAHNWNAHGCGTEYVQYDAMATLNNADSSKAFEAFLQRYVVAAAGRTLTIGSVPDRHVANIPCFRVHRAPPHVPPKRLHVVVYCEPLRKR